MNIFSRKSKKGINVDGSSPAGSTKNEKSSKKSSRDQRRCLVLGVPLKQAVQNNPSFDGIPVPALVRNCLDYVTQYGLQLEGIYRVSPPKSRLDELEQLANLDRHNEIVFQDAHEAAGLLKRFLRQLPEDILTSQLRQTFDDIAKKCTCDPMGVCTCPVALQIKELLLQLPTENFYLLAYVFRHAQLVIQQESFNKMGLPALGVLLQAILNNIKRPLVKMFIMNASDLFSGNSKTGRYGGTETTLPHFLFDTVDIKPYIKPKSIEELRKNTPATIEEIEEEIGKQQNLLEYLHEQVQQTRLQSTQQEESVKTKGEEMWAVQTGITVLRRRLKALLEQREEQQQRQQQQQQTLLGGHSNNAGDDDNNVLAMFNDGIDNGIGTDGEDGDSAASTSMQMNTAALVEKQLLAVQMALLEEIADEKRKIAHLLSVLRELRNQLPEEDQNRLTIFQRATNDESQQRKSVMSIRSSSSNGRLQIEQQQLGQTTTPTEDALSQSSCNWEELCQAEESRREQLLADLIRYRRICSQLRARLEQNTMLVKLKQQQQLRMLAGPDGTGEVLLPTPIGQQQQQQKPPPPISPKPDRNGNNDDGIVKTVTCTTAIAKNNTLHGINDSSASAVLIAREDGTVGDNDDDNKKNKTRSANNLLLVTRF